MLTAGQEARKRFQSAAMELTLGGEPTYVPLEPKGAEWSVAADGPSKLSYARALAKQLESDVLPGSICFFAPVSTIRAKQIPAGPCGCCVNTTANHWCRGQSPDHSSNQQAKCLRRLESAWGLS
ncbi:transglutaminase family protein [Synechococcus lacustris Tous-12m]